MKMTKTNLLAIFLMIACAISYANGQIASVKGMCPKVSNAAGMTHWTQGLERWYKIAQSSNPLMNIRAYNPPNTTITCEASTRFEKLCDCDGAYGPRFLIHDYYTNQSMRMPEVTQYGKVSVPNPAGEPGVWYVELFDQGSYLHRVIEFKENDYMFVFICKDVFDSATHGTAQWTHDEHAILYTRERPERMTVEKKQQLMDVMNQSLVKNNIWHVSMSWVGGKINGENC